MIKKITLFLISGLILQSIGFARPFRVGQVPNGGKNSCMTCHTGNGGPRNTFGQTVEQGYLQDGNVVWNAELAALDSDGDGFSNGTELLDPSGTWISGDDDPGNSDEVYNPGDASSHPDGSAVTEYEFVSSINAYPNPFVSTLEIGLNIHMAGPVDIYITDLFGRRVATLSDGTLGLGHQTVIWNGAYSSGSLAPSGRYFLVAEQRKRKSTVMIVKW